MIGETVTDPCIPSDWKGFKASRKFRGAVYRIEALNPDGKSKGVNGVLVDGKLQLSNLIPVFGDGKEHTVRVVLG